MKQDQKLIIIGATAAGMTFASKMSRYKTKINHVVYEKRSYTSLGACGIPYYVGGKAKNEQQLIAATLESHLKNGINVKASHEVIKVNTMQKKIVVKDLKTNIEFEDKYDKLFIGTGATPFIPPVPGIHLKNVFTATTFEDAIALRKIAEDKKLINIAIIGGGFIGMELAENFLNWTKKIRIIEMQKKPVSKVFDHELTDLLLEELTKNSVEFQAEEKLLEIMGQNKVEGIRTDKGEYKVDAVVLAVGFKPNTLLFKDQIEMYNNGSIKVNRMGMSSNPDVYAAGDCVSVYNPILKKDGYFPLATTSRKLATIAYENLIEGKKTKFLGSTGTSGFRFEGIEMFATGISKEVAKSNNINSISTFINASDSASYAGESKQLWLKLVADTSGKILGAQAAGTNKSAAIRIAALSVAVSMGMNVRELEQLDLFYTPPFSGATDIIHIAGRILSKQLK